MRHKRVVLIIILLTSICFTLSIADIIPQAKAAVPTGTIKIIKDAQPDFHKKFKFSGDLGKFSLTDEPSKKNYELFENIPAKKYVVKEDEDHWWKVDSITWTGGSVIKLDTNSVEIDLKAGETIEVTFVNVPKVTPGWIITGEHELLDDLNVKFTYHVQSTEQYAISYWKLYSCCIDNFEIVEASEEYVIEDHWIKFTEGYEGDEARDVWFIIHMEYYTACRIGPTTYYIKGAELAAEGTVVGPSHEGFYIPENPLGTLGAIIPLLAALGLIIASKKKIITIKVEK